MLAGEKLFKRKDAIFGVVGSPEMGVLKQMMRDDPDAYQLKRKPVSRDEIAPYICQRPEVKVGVISTPSLSVYPKLTPTSIFLSWAIAIEPVTTNAMPQRAIFFQLISFISSL